ncbi:hypothetical protein CAOG_07266 [Capsaspora owczarzaki ATCC 30864]|nr:hypothetical protein CAOG_07266 [Capsaspora owczarzaki ATCC 30864]|eukprot:XP_004343125.1 hypothetical protein CAOG_07266 [Capsaspora owczarzaki ATCC 30864]
MPVRDAAAGVQTPQPLSTEPSVSGRSKTSQKSLPVAGSLDEPTAGLWNQRQENSLIDKVNADTPTTTAPDSSSQPVTQPGSRPDNILAESLLFTPWPEATQGSLKASLVSRGKKESAAIDSRRSSSGFGPENRNSSNAPRMTDSDGSESRNPDVQGEGQLARSSAGNARQPNSRRRTSSRSGPLQRRAQSLGDPDLGVSGSTAMAAGVADADPRIASKAKASSAPKQQSSAPAALFASLASAGILSSGNGVFKTGPERLDSIFSITRLKLKMHDKRHRIHQRYLHRHRHHHSEAEQEDHPKEAASTSALDVPAINDPSAEAAAAVHPPPQLTHRSLTLALPGQIDAAHLYTGVSLTGPTEKFIQRYQELMVERLHQSEAEQAQAEPPHVRALKPQGPYSEDLPRSRHTLVVTVPSRPRLYGMRMFDPTCRAEVQAATADAAMLSNPSTPNSSSSRTANSSKRSSSMQPAPSADQQPQPPQQPQQQTFTSSGEQPQPSSSSSTTPPVLYEQRGTIVPTQEDAASSLQLPSTRRIANTRRPPEDWVMAFRRCFQPEDTITEYFELLREIYFGRRHKKKRVRHNKKAPLKFGPNNRSRPHGRLHSPCSVASLRAAFGGGSPEPTVEVEKHARFAQEEATSIHPSPEAEDAPLKEETAPTKHSGKRIAAVKRSIATAVANLRPDKNHKRSSGIPQEASDTTADAEPSTSQSIAASEREKADAVLHPDGMDDLEEPEDDEEWEWLADDVPPNVRPIRRKMAMASYLLIASGRTKLKEIREQIHQFGTDKPHAAGGSHSPELGDDKAEAELAHSITQQAAHKALARSKSTGALPVVAGGLGAGRTVTSNAASDHAVETEPAPRRRHLLRRHRRLETKSMHSMPSAVVAPSPALTRPRRPFSTGLAAISEQTRTSSASANAPGANRREPGVVHTACTCGESMHHHHARDSNNLGVPVRESEDASEQGDHAAELHSSKADISTAAVSDLQPPTETLAEFASRLLRKEELAPAAPEPNPDGLIHLDLGHDTVGVAQCFAAPHSQSVPTALPEINTPHTDSSADTQTSPDAPSQNNAYVREGSVTSRGIPTLPTATRRQVLDDPTTLENTTTARTVHSSSSDQYIPLSVRRVLGIKPQVPSAPTTATHLPDASTLITTQIDIPAGTVERIADRMSLPPALSVVTGLARQVQGRLLAMQNLVREKHKASSTVENASENRRQQLADALLRNQQYRHELASLDDQLKEQYDVLNRFATAIMRVDRYKLRRPALERRRELQEATDTISRTNETMSEQTDQLLGNDGHPKLLQRQTKEGDTTTSAPLPGDTTTGLRGSQQPREPAAGSLRTAPPSSAHTLTTPASARSNPFGQEFAPDDSFRRQLILGCIPLHRRPHSLYQDFLTGADKSPHESRFTDVTDDWTEFNEARYSEAAAIKARETGVVLLPTFDEMMERLGRDAAGNMQARTTTTTSTFYTETEAGSHPGMLGSVKSVSDANDPNCKFVVAAEPTSDIPNPFVWPPVPSVLQAYGMEDDERAQMWIRKELGLSPSMPPVPRSLSSAKSKDVSPDDAIEE